MLVINVVQRLQMNKKKQFVNSHNMKRFIFALLAVLFTVGVSLAFGQDNYKREGNSFTQVATLKSSTDVQTVYTYQIKDIVYPIWITQKGRCYIVRTSKNGNQYKQYLEKDICLQICKELGIEYQE